MYKESNKDIYNKDNTYAMRVWEGDYNSREERRTYWGKFNRAFKFGRKDCERGQDFWNVNEYISEHSFDLG